MTLRHLEIFIAVADALNMTLAAEKLFIAQPSVSQSISELERHLKTRLFERLNRKLYLTAAGIEFLSYARHIISLVGEAEARMLEKGKWGRIRAGGSLTVGTTILNGIIKRFNLNCPGCEVSLRVDNTHVLETMLLSNSLDVALAEGFMKSDQITSKVIMQDEMVLICPPFHRFAGKASVLAGELARESFMIREEGSGTRELFESVMSANGVEYRVGGVLNNAEAIKLAVKEGMGISVISKLSVQREVERGELFALKIKGMRFVRNFSLFHHRSKYLTPALVDFMRMCEKPL